MSWKWYLKDIKQDKPVSVFSCFSCGGGSSMGYKKAGFKVLGNVEIDPSINEMYKKNNHPKYNYNMDLRDFNKLENLPEELYHLDILDGSPPCSTFSTAGEREKNWGKKKAFREGQKKQVLDDLFFTFLDTVEKLKPKIVVAENVVGLITGNARGYVNQIIKRFKELGYDVQIFRLNAAQMDVPQTRERIFFIANNQGYKKLQMKFNYKSILFKEVRTKSGKQFTNNTVGKYLLKQRIPTDKSIADINMRLYGKNSGFTRPIIHDNRVCNTITAGADFFRYCDGLLFSDYDFINVQTFPQDYNFCGLAPQYACGMSVPPNMMENIAKEIWNQWLKEDKDRCMKK